MGLFTILGLLALVAWKLVLPMLSPGTFVLDAPTTTTLHVGDQGTIPVRVTRHNFAGPVQVKILYDKDILGEDTIAGEDNSVPVHVNLPAESVLGNRKIRIEATTDLGVETKDVDLTVAPLRTLPEPSPAGIFSPEAGSGIVNLSGVKKVRMYYKHIECWVGAMPVRFVLVPYSGEGRDDRPFYIMEDKVSNRLYAQWPESKSGNLKDNDLPVLGVDYGPAYRFARWLGGPAGFLPLTDQWDAAAGRFEGKGDGPFQGSLDDLQPDDVALKRKVPMPVGTAKKDIGWLGCRDMAGNGLEWTRNYRLVENSVLEKIREEGTDLPKQATVILRGRDFHEPEPLLWEDIVIKPVFIPFFPSERKEYHNKELLERTGFRVVIQTRAD